MENGRQGIRGRDAKKHGLYYGLAYGTAAALITVLVCCQPRVSPMEHDPVKVAPLPAVIEKPSEEPVRTVNRQELLDWHAKNIEGLLKKKEGK